MKLFLTISGILFLCVIVAAFVIYGTIGVLPTQQSSTEATVPSQDSVLKKRKNLVVAVQLARNGGDGQSTSGKRWSKPG